MMKFSLLTFAFLMLIGYFPLSAQAMDEAPIIEAPVITAVSFYSDYCGTCKALDPKVKEAMGTINNAKIDTIRFDFSSKEAIAETKRLAKRKNVQGVLQQYGAKTGFVALVNHDGDIIDTLSIADTPDNMAAKLANAIASASE